MCDRESCDDRVRRISEITKQYHPYCLPHIGCIVLVFSLTGVRMLKFVAVSFLSVPPTCWAVRRHMDTSERGWEGGNRGRESLVGHMAARRTAAASFPTLFKAIGTGLPDCIVPDCQIGPGVRGLQW